MSEKHVLADLFTALEMTVLEHVGTGRFRLLAEPPEWFTPFLDSEEPGKAFEIPERMVFLENFAVDAAQIWAKPCGETLSSGPWVEQAVGGDIYLEAMAVAPAGHQILLIRKLGQSYLERRELLQKAREKSLTYQHLAKEVQKKEVLLHCIVHDLAGPLTGIKSLFSLLGKEELSETGKRRLEIGREATERLEEQIRRTLEVFSAELEALEAFSSDPATAPDLADCLRSVVEILTPAASLRNLTLEVSPAHRRGASWKVVGERSRLERVLFNLIDNALRHCSEGGGVVIRVAQNSRNIQVNIEDNGPGVPDEEVPKLFQRFFQGTGNRGKAGLGLYFCRIVVERWGGAVGFEPRTGGGSIFWFRLPRVAS